MSSRFLIIALIFLSSAFSESPKLKLGFSLPLSGPLAEFGQSARNGIELARRDNPHLFPDVEFYFEDNQYDPKHSLNVFRKFQDEEHADLLFVWGSGTCLAVAALSEQSRRPLFCLSGDPKPGYKYVFSFNPPFDDYAERLKQLVLKKKFKSLGVFTTEVPFLTNLQRAFEAQVRSDNEVKISFSETVTPDVQDFRSLLLKFKGTKRDAVALFLLPHQIKPYIEQSKALGVSSNYIGADTFTSSLLKTETGNLLEGAYYVDLPIKTQFVERYEATFGNQNNVTFAGNTYEYATLVASLFIQTGDKSKIIDALRQVKNRNGVAGMFSYAERPDYGQYLQFQVQLNMIQGGKFVSLPEASNF